MSTDRTQHVIDAIDGALGDYSVSSDAMRWTPEPVKPRPFVFVAPVCTTPPIDPDRVAVVIRALGDEVSRVLRAVADAIASAAPTFQRLHDALRDAGMLPEDPPEDARARALWLQQRRNTGPSRDLTRQKRPRSLT